jgi:hypothetical protein
VSRPAYPGVYLNAIKALYKIVGEYVKVGETKKAADLLSQSLEVAKAIEDKDLKDSALSEIGFKYAKVGNQLSENDFANLHAIVQEIIPMDNLVDILSLSNLDL